MSYSPILLLHILAGTTGLLSGTAALCFRKGSHRHVLAGKIFVISIFAMAVDAIYLAIVKQQPNNIGGGLLTFYLIGTAWLTARRRRGETNPFDWARAPDSPDHRDSRMDERHRRSAQPLRNEI